MSDSESWRLEIRNTGTDAGYGGWYDCKECDAAFSLMTALLIHEYDVHGRPRPEGPFHLGHPNCESRR